MTAPSTGAARPVAATFVLVGSLLFLWYTVGVAVQLGVSALQPSHYREAGPVFGVAAVLCLVLALWLRGSRAKVAGVVVTLVGVGLLTFALWSRRADWHFLAGSLPVAGAVFVLIGGLAGLRTVR